MDGSRRHFDHLQLSRSDSDSYWDSTLCFRQSLRLTRPRRSVKIGAMGLPHPRSRTRAGRWLRRRRALILTVGLFGLLAVADLRTDGLDGNDLETFVYTKHWLDPTFIRNDWRLDQSPGPRLPFMVLAAPLVKVLPIERAAILGRPLGFMLLSIAAAFLLVQIGLSPLEGVVVVAAYLALGQSLAAGEWLVGNFESKVVAYACVLLALATASSRLVAAGTALGFATTVHLLVGGWATLLLAAAAWRTDVATARDRWKAIAAWLLFASPGIAIALLSIEGSTATLRDAVAPEWIYVKFRVPHHLDPGYFLAGTVAKARVGLAVLAALLLVALPRLVRRGAPLLLAVRFFEAAMALFVVGIVLSLVPGGERFLRLYPLRVGDGLGLLLGLAMALALAKRWLRTPCARSVLLLALVVSGLAAATRLHPIRHGVVPPAGFDNVARWVKAHTPPGEPVLVSPHIIFAGYWLERPVVVQFKFVPHGERAREWYERLVDLSGGVQPETRSFHASGEVHQRFMSLPPEAYRALATKYGARYLVRTERADLSFVVAYQSGEWAVYDVGGP
jgi:hypothetical protein